MRVKTRIEHEGVAIKTVVDIQSSSSSDPDFEPKRRKRSKVEDIDPPLSPCLLPQVAEDSVWSFNPAEEVLEAEVVNYPLFNEEEHEQYLFDGVRHISPKKYYVKINTREWATKYNDLLQRCRDSETKNKLLKKQVRYYRNKLEDINELSKDHSFH